MTDTVFPLELLEKDEPGFWPWVIAALAVLLMLVSAARQLDSIPRYIETSATDRLATLPLEAVTFTADGRDLKVAGSIDPDVDRNALFERLTSIDGVRVVYDELTVIDPAAETRAQKALWLESLRQIDVSGVAFEPNSATIAPGSDTSLIDLANLLRQAPELRIRVAGHTDNTGRAAVNLELSRSRARSVADYLADRGVAVDQLIAQGYGDTQPVADNGIESGRARNRRIEIRYVD